MSEQKKTSGNKPTPARKKPLEAWLYTEANRSECLALKAVYAGTATPDQQRKAMQWILVKACRVNDLNYRPTPPFAEQDTFISIGKRSVGLEIQREIDRPVQLLPGYDPNSEQGI